jgi:predicted N-acyltransferase
MRWAYLAALQTSQSAHIATGWQARWVTLWRNDILVGACPFYIKDHSYGEYVFDWAWAQAYQQHGLPYYPKGVIAVPFTPVPGSRLLALDDETRRVLLRVTLEHAKEEGLSSVHLLFASPDDMAVATELGLSQRQTVQFHWVNEGYQDFDDFLSRLSQDKRKKIRQERRKVAQAGVTFETLEFDQISLNDWDFFYRCYEQTYDEHGNAPYLTRDFFQQMQTQMAHHWVMFKAMKEGQPIACSLIAINDWGLASASAYGRYWGALARVDCLHFEACYYQPLEWCIKRGVACFEGGAQGEHKLSRALMPVVTHSAHWLAHPQFAAAVENFVQRESAHQAEYLQVLQAHSPFKA